MRFAVGVTAAAAAGAVVGFVLGAAWDNKKMVEENKHAQASFRRALEAARIDAQTPVATEMDLISVSRPLGEETTRLEGGELEVHGAEAADRYEGGEVVNLVDFAGEKKDEVRTNPYHTPVAETSPKIYASYAELEEEDYYEEDGRVKEQLTMVYIDNVPHFFSQGEEIDDAFERVGGTIVDDMREAVREGNPIIWVRNNQTDVDYEVIFEQP